VRGLHARAASFRNDPPQAYFPSRRLTETGVEQAKALGSFVRAEGVRTDAVLVSPLSRAVGTALAGFSEQAADERIPFEAVEILRERNGTHPCDKRRTRAELVDLFPRVDFGHLPTDEDAFWTEEREPWKDVVERAQRVLEVLRLRPESHIAVVTHNDLLMAIFLERIMHRATSDPMRITFPNARLLSTVLSWREEGAAAES